MHNPHTPPRTLPTPHTFVQVPQAEAAVLRSQPGGGGERHQEDAERGDPGPGGQDPGAAGRQPPEVILSVQDVLDDNDFVSIVLETDRPNPSTEQAEVGLRDRRARNIIISMSAFSEEKFR